MCETGCEMVHCQWLDRLSGAERNIVASLGFDAAYQLELKVEWGGHRSAVDHAQWEVIPANWEAEYSCYPWRLPTREELNERLDADVG